MNKNIKVGDTLYSIIWITREIATANPEKVVGITSDTIETDDGYYKISDLDNEHIFTNEKDAQAESDRLTQAMQLSYNPSSYK